MDVDAVTIASISMQNDLQRLSSIAQNLANANTAGYKRQVTASRPFAAFLQDGNAVDGGNLSNIGNLGSPSNLDMRVGTLRQTGNNFDVAVEGEGFFEVDTGAEPAYARQGTMRVDGRGRLVTQQGLPLVGLDGDVRPNGGVLTIDAQGGVRQGERSLGQIKLVRFANPGRMAPLGNGLYTQGGAVLAEQSVKPGALRSGFLENSNVESAQEMVRLTETVRHFEAMQKVMQGYDDLFDTTLRKLGEF
jgi:flagellar basal body rod protein FlgG